MLSLLVLIEQSHGTTFVTTVGDKKGEVILKGLKTE